MSNVFGSYDRARLDGFMESRFNARDYERRGYIFAGLAPSQEAGGLDPVEVVEEYLFPEDVWVIHEPLSDVMDVRLTPFSAGGGGYWAGPIESNRLQLLVFQAGTDSWKARRDSPSVAVSHEGVGHEDEGYVFSTGLRDPYKTTMKYRPRTDIWKTLTQHPGTRRVDATIALIDDKVYMYEGWDIDARPQTALDECLEYNPRRDSWKKMEDSPFKAMVAAGGELDGEAFFCGGFEEDIDPENPSRRSYSFAPARQRWRRRANLEVARTAHRGFTLKPAKSFFAVGGLYKKRGEVRWTGYAFTEQFISSQETWVQRSKYGDPLRGQHGSWTI